MPHYGLVFFLFFLDKKKKKNRGGKPARTYCSVRAGITSLFCQAALMGFCTPATSTLVLYSLVRCNFLCYDAAFWLFLEYYWI